LQQSKRKATKNNFFPLLFFQNLLTSTMDACAYFETVSEVYDSWERVKRVENYQETVGIALFDKMFMLAPDEEWGMFTWNREDFQNKDEKFMTFAKKFVRMLDMAIDMLGPDMEIVEEQMYELGGAHQRYGVLPVHFDIMGRALALVLADLLGDRFTATTKSSWKSVYGFMSTTMIQGSVGI